MIAYYATREHYVDHLAPIWQQTSGAFHITPRVAHQTVLDVQHPVSGRAPAPRSRPVVAAGMDLGSRERCVLVEHGAGQSYRGVHHVSWSGGESRQNVELFIVPNARTSTANRVRYPDTHNVIAAPRVEQLRNLAERGLSAEFDVVFGRHWDTYLAPELSSAWPHHFDAIRRYCLENRWRVALHFHPRCEDVGRVLAREWGVTYLDTFDEVVMHGVAFVVDNSSAGFEWAALDRPVVWLNAPHYRRDVEHGLRFWSHVDVGTQVDEPGLLEPAIENALRYDPMAKCRRDLIRDVFPIIDGSALRAAAAIEQIAQVGDGWMMFWICVGLVVAAFVGILALGMCAANEFDNAPRREGIGWTLILNGLAVYRLWRLAAKDTILDGPRAKFEEWAWKHRRDYTQGSRLMVLISCGFCLGFWISVAAIAAERYVPRVWMVARAILATSALAGLVAVVEAKVEE